MECFLTRGGGGGIGKNMNKKLGCWNMHLLPFVQFMSFNNVPTYFVLLFFYHFILQYCKWTLNLYFEAFTYEIFIQLPFNIHFYSHEYIFLFGSLYFVCMHILPTWWRNFPIRNLIKNSISIGFFWKKFLKHSSCFILDKKSTQTCSNECVYVDKY
jgi:hypothetical protein